MPTGTYSLTVHSPGFRTVVLDPITLTAAVSARLDIDLTPGAPADQIIAEPQLSNVEPEENGRGTTASADLIAAVPLRADATRDLAAVAPGGTGKGQTRIEGSGRNRVSAVSGEPPGSGDVSIEGLSLTMTVSRAAGVSAWTPPLEAVAEFNFQSGTLPAEYGRSSASIENIVIKSGTNVFHMAAYGYLRDSTFDANFFFSRGAGQNLRPYKASTFGVSLEGPAYVPRFYNGSNRTFFFLNYERSDADIPSSFSSNVPTDAMRVGDFSESSAPIYNPFSVHTVDGLPVRDPFPGNRIPESIQDPAGRTLLSYYPRPDVKSPDPLSPWVKNWLFVGTSSRSYNALISKLDHITAHHQASLRVYRGSTVMCHPSQFDGIATPGRDRVRRSFLGLTAGDTFSMTSRTLLDFRIAYSARRDGRVPWSEGFDLSSVGFPTSLAQAVENPTFPGITAVNFQGLGGTPYIRRTDYSSSFVASTSLKRGKHQAKIGFEGALIRGELFRNVAPSGQYAFDASWTAGPRADVPSIGTGSVMASLLVGLGAGSITYTAPLSLNSTYIAAYLQDDVRVTSSLTINVGLRYHYQTPWSERDDRLTHGFAYSDPSPLDVPGLVLRGGLLYAERDDDSRRLLAPDRNNFSPRLGFAYSVLPHTVIRAGGAISYLPVPGSIRASGYEVTTRWATSADGIHPLRRLSDPFPDGLVQPTANTAGMLTLVGQDLYFVDPSDRTPILYNWHFDVQREFGSLTLVEVSYVGSRGVHLVGGPTDYATILSQQINQLDPVYLAQGARLLEPVDNPFYGVIAVGPLSQSTVSRAQLLRPYPHFMSVQRQFPAYGNSIYHAMQMQVSKRLRHGVTALGSYSVSKNISDIATAENAYDRTGERALSEFDAPQRLSLAISWMLPFGRSRRWGANASSTLDRVIGNWQISTLCTFQSGFPVALRLSRQNVYLPDAVQRPRVIGDPTAGVTGSIQSRLARYFNTAAFVQPEDFTFGNVGPRVGWIRSPGVNNVDLRLAKEVRVTERLLLGFRASAFNALNHPVFSAPNTTLGGASFGRVFNQTNTGRQVEMAVKMSF